MDQSDVAWVVGICQLSLLLLRCRQMLGSVWSSPSLCVVEPGCPPEFVIVLKPCDVKEGEKAEFSCQVTGNPPPEVTWLFDGQPLQGKGQYALLTKNKLQVGEKTARH